MGMLWRANLKIEKLAEEMVERLPERLFRSAITTFLDPAFGGGQFLIAIAKRLKRYGHSKANILSRLYGYEDNELYIANANLGVLNGANLSVRKYSDYVSKGTDMKFDVVIGNPPFQDGNKTGGQNKLYGAFSKKSLSLLKENGSLAFITPIPVTRPNKRFSLIGEPGLEYVNFQANNHFTVGITVCSWIINRKYSGTPTVINSDGSINTHCDTNTIFDECTSEKNFLLVHDAIKNATKDLSTRMFQRNNFGTALSKNATSENIYPIKNNKDSAEPFWYSSRVPHFYKKTKVALKLSGSYTIENIFTTTDDMDLNHVVCEINNDSEVENIKSFLFSNYFVSLINSWKKYINSKSYDMLVYLPEFDKTKKWDDQLVQKFIEGFLV
jgi:hypothetical protein